MGNTGRWNFLPIVDLLWSSRDLQAREKRANEFLKKMNKKMVSEFFYY